MAEHKLIRHKRLHTSKRRDISRQSDEEFPHMIDPRAEEPCAVAACHELLVELRARLSDQARYLADQRAAGRTWRDLAAELGKSAEALRIQHRRAVRQAARQMRLEDLLKE